MYFNLYEVSSDEEDYLPPDVRYRPYQYIPRRPKLIKERFDFLNILTESQFFSRFRLTKLTVLELLQLIEPQIATRTNNNNALQPMNRLLLTLRYFATGSFFISAGDFSGVSKSTAFNVVENVTEAIVSLRDQYIRMPNTPEEMAQTSALFARMKGFPRVIGVIDGTHIKIQSPGGVGAENYRNRKGFFSKNVQVIAGPALEILDVVTRWQGSAHDQTVLNGSDIHVRLENGEFQNYHLLVDAGYECRAYLMTPLQRVRTPAENLYNESLIRTRQSVERLFGVWKRRFPILSLGIRTSRRKFRKADFFIVACAILHNIACQNREDEPPIEIHVGADEPNQDYEHPLIRERENNPRYQARRDLINGWFGQMV